VIQKIKLSVSVLATLVAIVAGGVSQPRGATAPAGPIALVGGTLIDGTGGTPVRNSVVLTNRERIEKVGTVASVPVPAGYERISTEGMTVLPGLWDPHVHLIYAGYPNLQEYLQKYSSQLDTIMPAMAEQFLLSGVTSIRDLGAPLSVLTVKKRIQQGDIPGPTIYAAGPFLTTAAFGPHSIVVTDEADARAATRRLLDAGVDIIKFVNADRMQPGVAKAIVREAHARGKKATAHGRSDAEIRVCLDADIDELQHIGYESPEYSSDIIESIRRRIAAGRPLSWSPTVGTQLDADEIAFDHEFLDDPRNFKGVPQLIAADVRQAVAAYSARPPRSDTRKIVDRKIGQLRELGVQLVFGSDEGSFGATAAQATARELEAWVRDLGFTPMAAITKATLEAAKHVGAERDSGSVADGKFADVIAVEGNPLRHIDVLANPAVVIRHGRRYK
jgi:imidazolonepropionase-like amidohydrolase